ncbi:MAG: ankyrin repeat domain-containing protein [Fibromonadaceae bacterium]|jgi:uncharacterized protein (TIGR02145 family)|nr:ankyrin repeat domain-containing protein [Fibromonadaceae bacterium]
MKFTDIFEATIDGTVEDVRYFVEQKGVDVNAKNSSGFTALHAAAKNGYVEVSKLLISKGADVNVKMDSGYTPLHAAVMSGYVEVSKFLVSVGADVNAKDNNGDTTLHIAAMNDGTAMNDGHEVTQFLASVGADVNMKNKGGVPPLYTAIITGKIEIIKALISSGADVKAKCGDNQEPLLYSAIQARNIGIADKIEIVKILISAGADKSNNGFNALHVAINIGNIEITKILISANADVNAKDNNGFTPLHVATFKGNIEAAKLLVFAKADINAKEKNGCTSLHIAVGTGQSIEFAQLLVSADADVNARDNNGFTPLETARNLEKTEMVQYLSSIGRPHQPAFYAKEEETNKKSKVKVIIIALVILGIFFWLFSGSGKTAQSKENMPPEKERLEASTFTDQRNGKTYKAIKIGTQTWMAENLDYYMAGSVCYDNLASNCTEKGGSKYGRLYNWVTAMALPSSCGTSNCSSSISAKHRGICPVGWHIPSNDDWGKLFSFLEGMGETAARAYMYTNFATQFGGGGYPNGSFGDAGYYIHLWKAEDIGIMSIASSESNNYESNIIYDFNKNFLFNVRCIKD